MTWLLVDVAGWFAAGSLLTAYFLVSTRRVSGDGLGFQLLNLAGGAGLLLNGVHHGAWPSAGLNAVWVVICLTALARTRRPDPLSGPRPSRTPAGQRPDSGAVHPH
jgi:hypothetical protein